MGPKPISIPIQTAGYTVLPLTHPATHNFPSQTTSYVYVKAHEPSDGDAHSRALFLTNVPIDGTAARIRSLFARPILGSARVESVEFDGGYGSSRRLGSADEAVTPSNSSYERVGHNNRSKKRKRSGSAAQIQYPDLPPTWERPVHRSGSTAVVSFVDRASAQMALKAVKRFAATTLRKQNGRGQQKQQQEENLLWSFPELAHEPPLGLTRYKSHHSMQFPSSVHLHAAVDAFMDAFSEREAVKTKELAKLAAGVPDEDGFVTVVRGARGGGGAAKVDERRAVELKIKREEREKREQEARGQVGDFYRFQVRERKMREAVGVAGRFRHTREKVFGK